MYPILNLFYFMLVFGLEEALCARAHSGQLSGIPRDDGAPTLLGNVRFFISSGKLSR